MEERRVIEPRRHPWLVQSTRWRIYGRVDYLGIAWRLPAIDEPMRCNSAPTAGGTESGVEVSNVMHG